MTVVCEGHQLRLIDNRVVHVQANDCHQYFIAMGQQVVACDGVGNPEPKLSVSNQISERLAGAIRRLEAKKWRKP